MGCSAPQCRRMACEPPRGPFWACNVQLKSRLKVKPALTVVYTVLKRQTTSSTTCFPPGPGGHLRPGPGPLALRPKQHPPPTPLLSVGVSSVAWTTPIAAALSNASIETHPPPPLSLSANCPPFSHPRPIHPTYPESPDRGIVMKVEGGRAGHDRGPSPARPSPGLEVLARE